MTTKITAQGILGRFATRRQVIIGASQATLAVGGAGLLAGCQTTQGYQRQSLADLLIDDGTGAVPYLSIIGDLPETSWSDKGLPIGKMRVSQLKGEMAWMKAYDFDGDKQVHKGEMTQGWLVRIAQLKTGKDYAPDSLKIYPQTASLLAAIPATQSLQGITLGTDEEKAMRSVLGSTGDTATKAAVKAMVTSINATFAATGGGGDGGSGGGSDGGSDGGSSGGGSCFIAETPVLMGDGTYKFIADIDIGDEVTSYDFTSGEKVANKVVRLYQSNADTYLRLNDGLLVTEGHPFAIGGDEWITAGELRTGDKVVGDGDQIRLGGIERINQPIPIFNLTVDGSHNYYVAEVEGGGGGDSKKAFLVHNKGSSGGL